jgi:transporter family-2 protein
MNAGWIIPFIILGGALQSCGAVMNGQLKTSLVNPWLASAASSRWICRRDASHSRSFL